MMRFKKAAILLAFLLSACVGGMLPGHIYSSDGRVLSFAIEKSYGSGKVSASDPRTGEQFTGTYVGIMERVDSINTALIDSGEYKRGRLETETSTKLLGIDSVGSNMANATAFLQGDQGTMLNCVMKIESGFSPHGIGSCEDNKRLPYRLQF